MEVSSHHDLSEYATIDFFSIAIDTTHAIFSILFLANKQNKGFGHIGITVPNVYTACERFHKLGVPFHKSPNAGGMKGLAFIKDPDGYLIEILPQGEMIVEDVDCLGVAAEGGEGYKDNSK